MDKLSGEETVPKLLPPFSKGIYTKRKGLAALGVNSFLLKQTTFSKGLGLQNCKQAVTNFLSLVTMANNLQSNLFMPTLYTTLRKYAYSNILNITPPKTESFQIKNSDNFQIYAQNMDCGYPLEPPRRGGSNEYPQSMVLSRNKRNNVYPCKPQFYYIKVGFKGVKII